jgi:hypothetical protein
VTWDELHRRYHFLEHIYILTISQLKEFASMPEARVGLKIISSPSPLRPEKHGPSHGNCPKQTHTSWLLSLCAIALPSGSPVISQPFKIAHEALIPHGETLTRHTTKWSLCAVAFTFHPVVPHWDHRRACVLEYYIHCNRWFHDIEIEVVSVFFCHACPRNLITQNLWYHSHRSLMILAGNNWPTLT